jgi:CRISPR system Cascade subunit CasD
MLGPAEGLNTIITYRDYLADAGFSACLWPTVDEPPYTLSEMAEALRRPTFVPYLGRKSCPLGVPLDPRLVEADNLAAAFAEFPVDGKVSEGISTKPTASVELFWDSGIDSGAQQTRTEHSRDLPISRSRWQFASREMSVGIVEAPKHREWK